MTYVAAEVLPEAERHRGQQEPAAAATVVDHAGLVAVGGWLPGHAGSVTVGAGSVA